MENVLITRLAELACAGKLRSWDTEVPYNINTGLSACNVLHTIEFQESALPEIAKQLGGALMTQAEYKFEVSSGTIEQDPTGNYNFFVRDKDSIDFSEIIKHLSRKNPLAIINIKEENPVAIVHSSLIVKARAIGHPLFGEDPVGYLNCTIIKWGSTAAIIKWAKRVRTAPWPKEAKTLNVQVIIPKI